MAKITLKGNPIHTSGELPEIGKTAKDFSLTDKTLQDKSLNDFKGKKLVLNIFPSLDTPVCAASVRRFNSEAEKMENTTVLCISRDLPFAHSRFCEAEGLDNVITLSELRELKFGEDYGLRITDGPMKGLLARVVIILDEEQKIIYTELVPEITQEPDYESALKKLL